MRKLYLTLEDGDLKIDRVIEIDDSVYDKYISEIIHDMEDTLDKTLKEDELVTEAKRLTSTRD